jgi:hypothetical protein
MGQRRGACSPARARVSRRYGARPSCFETHRSAAELCRRSCSLRAAMLLSMRVRGRRAAGSLATLAPPPKAALILPAWVSSCAAVLLRGSIPSCLRAPVPPEARSGPFPARLAGGAAIWCRRPNACTLARTRGILWGMRPWRALRGGQAGARPVSQPPAPACELPMIKVKISHWRRLR